MEQLKGTEEKSKVKESQQEVFVGNMTAHTNGS